MGGRTVMDLGVKVDSIKVSKGRFLWQAYDPSLRTQQRICCPGEYQLFKEDSVAWS